jgi:hypothetical protein
MSVFLNHLQTHFNFLGLSFLYLNNWNTNNCPHLPWVFLRAECWWGWSVYKARGLVWSPQREKLCLVEERHCPLGAPMAIQGDKWQDENNVRQASLIIIHVLCGSEWRCCLLMDNPWRQDKVAISNPESVKDHMYRMTNWTSSSSGQILNSALATGSIPSCPCIALHPCPPRCPRLCCCFGL